MQVEEIMQNDRVQEILKGLNNGKTRDELAEEFEHANYKTLDIFMRRKGFVWNIDQQNYVLSIEPTKTAIIDTSKASTIIQLIATQETIDLKEVARITGFAGYKELAAYMEANHYRWVREEQNYVFEPVAKVEDSVNDTKVVSEEDTIGSSAKAVAALSSGKYAVTKEQMQDLWDYLPLLETLKANEDKLMDILNPYGASQIPRYIIPGIAKVKTVQMVHSLQQAVINFSNEKNISQKDIFEVALLDFFKKYGYEAQVELLLSGGQVTRRKTKK